MPGRTLLCILAVTLGLCSGPIRAAGTLRLATTTSTENSGLLGALLPSFEAETGYRVHVIAVGTGKALRMGRDGDVDVVLVHAPAAERVFVSQGHGLRRQPVMHNDFVLVGPRRDPAGISGLQDATQALQRIAAKGALFLSRGDDSGTHKKERALWAMAGIEPHGQWYREAGQGMGKVLQMASELEAYTLTDRGTWLALRQHSDLVLLAQEDPRLYNPYGIIAINPARHPDVNLDGAQALIAWLCSPEGQQRISGYRLQGEQLFHPDARLVSEHEH